MDQTAKVQAIATQYDRPDEEEVTRLVLQIQAKDDPAQNRKLKEMLRDFVVIKLKKFINDSRNLPAGFLNSLADDFLARHFDLPNTPSARQLSYLYQFSYDATNDIGFCAFLDNKLNREANVYEPHATWLVEQIQNGVDEVENKNRLLKLLYLFATLLAFRSMINKHYRKEDIEDAIPARLMKHLYGNRDGWLGSNHRQYYPCIYTYNKDYLSEKVNDDNRCFCGYFEGVMIAQFVTWCREMPGVKVITEKFLNEKGEIVNDERTGKPKTRTRYVNVETSIDVCSPNTDGDNFEANQTSIDASLREDELTRQAEDEKLQREIDVKSAKVLVLLFKKYFDKVNALDEYQEGPRAVHERGILSYHLKFALDNLSSALIDVKKKSDEYDYYEKVLASRPTSFRQLALGKWSQPLDSLVSYQNEDYQLVFQSDIDFLSRLESRIRQKRIEREVYLTAEKEINNKVHGWVNTIARRTTDDYQTIIMDGYKEARMVIGNEIRGY